MEPKEWKHKKGLQATARNPLEKMVGGNGFEPSTSGM